MIIDTYTRIPDRVQASQLTPENADDVAKWCGGRVERNEKPGDPSDVSVHLLVPNVDGLLRANAALKPFIVKDDEGRFTIRGDEKFLEEYQKPTRNSIPSLPENLQPSVISPLTPHYVPRGVYPNV